MKQGKYKAYNVIQHMRYWEGQGKDPAFGGAHFGKMCSTSEKFHPYKYRYIIFQKYYKFADGAQRARALRTGGYRFGGRYS